MFDNVLVGVDGRPGGDDAVALARQLAAPGARVTLANIYGSAGCPPGSGGMFLDEQRAETEAFLDRERDRRPDSTTVYACASTVGRGLHELAAHHDADLIVVGSPHRGIPGKVFIGDDTRAAFYGARCAIAIAPHGYAMAKTPLTRIAVAYDNTPESHRALAAGRHIAESTGAAITVMCAVGPEDVRQRAPLPADWPSATAALVDEAQRSLDAIGGVEGIAVSGGPREELTRLAEDVDLLIVGSRGYGPLGCLLHGSVSSYLERHVSSALLILPRDLAQTAAGNALNEQERAQTMIPAGR
jgi:nucleotide-binding universal stress UspA family protein